MEMTIYKDRIRLRIPREEITGPTYCVRGTGYRIDLRCAPDRIAAQGIDGRFLLRPRRWQAAYELPVILYGCVGTVTVRDALYRRARYAAVQLTTEPAQRQAG